MVFPRKPGRVSLVGAGPGDPELITLRGLRALEEADVVLYDRLVAREILNHARPGAELFYVGKRCGGHSMSQEEINRHLVELAASGKHVVRLKNGDPFVFGRGGEEVQALHAAGIPFEVIPGVTAALAAASYCGLPLTMRGLSSAVTLITAHEDPAKGHSDIDWAALARTGSTLVFYMAMAHLEEVVSRLITAGLSAEIPAAIVTRATLPEQVSLRAPLCQIPELVRKHGLAPPSVMVVGRVVEFGRQGGWFEALPLFGRTIVVAYFNGSPSNSGDGSPGVLIRKLRSLGARILELPIPRGETRKRLRDEPQDEHGLNGLDSLADRKADLLAITGSRCIQALEEMLRSKESSRTCPVPAAALGAAASRAAREAGFSVVISTQDEAPGTFLQAIQDYFHGIGRGRVYP